MIRAALFLLLSATPAWADSIDVPSPGLSRDAPVTFSYRLDRPLSGNGVLSIEWSDVHGRVVEQRAQAVTLTNGADIGFTLDLRRAAAMKNTVRARLALNAVSSTGAATRHAGAAEATFIATPNDDPWRTYQVIMWHSRSAAQYAALKQLGVSAGMVIPWRADPGQEMASPQIAAMLQNDLRWYVENTATDFYAAYHRWTPGKPVNWLYEEARRRYRADPQDLASRIRHPSLEDPAWRTMIAERLRRIVAVHAPYAPLYYSLADEPGIADLSANWDFDFGARSLAGFRDWLGRQYGSLDALNRQWGTRHASWDSIVPPTTAEAMRRRDQNYSAWSDFKDWMNLSFAGAARHGADAVRRADPRALAAMEGMQVSGWGGYDYARLAPELDLVEIYDVAGNNDVARSMNPRAVQILSSNGPVEDETHRLWQHWLRGGRGVLLWDEDSKFVDAAGVPGPRGQGHAAQFRELRNGLGALVIASEARVDRIALLYSPASFRARWMLDHRHLGDRWIERDAEREHEDGTALRTATSGFLNAVRGAGYQPYFITEQQVEQGLAGPGAPRVLVLPHVLALSDAAATSIATFAAGGGIVVADIVAGQFDQHVRRRSRPALQTLFAQGGRGRLLDPARQPEAAETMRRIARDAGLAPPVTLTDSQGGAVNDVELVLHRNGDTTLIGLLSLDPSRTGTVTATFPVPVYVRDVRAGREFGRDERIEIDLPARSPVLLALGAPAVAPAIEGPPTLRAGETATLAVTPAARSGSAVVRVDAIDPAGKVREAYSGTRILAPGASSLAIPFAINDPAGPWMIRATEILTGRAAEARIDLAPAWGP